MQSKPEGKSPNNKSVFQLFEALQQEYIICELRAKIYPIVKHKEYWRDLAKKKKQKIDDIAKRNLIPSIFDDKRIKQDFESRVYNETGLPNFYYPDPTKEEQQRYWDIINYFWLGAEVKFYIDGELKIGTISALSTEEHQVEITHNKTTLVLSIDKVARIL